MNDNRQWATPLIVLLLLIGSAALAVLWPTISAQLPGMPAAGGGGGGEVIVEAEPETVTIDPSGYLLGDELVTIPFIGEYNDRDPAERSWSSFSILGLLTVLVVGGVAVFTVPVGLLVVYSNRRVNDLEESERYKESRTALEKREKELAKQYKEEKPPVEKPDHERPVWSAWSTGMVAVILAYFFGLVLGEGFAAGSGGTLGTTFAVMAAVVSFFIFRPQKMQDVDESDYSSVNWGTLWVIISGAIMMGLGVGIMLVVMTDIDPFPFLVWEPSPAINWEWISEITGFDLVGDG